MYRNRLYIRCYNYTEHAVTIRLGVDPDHARRRAAWGPWRLACRYRIHDTRQGRRDRFWFFWNDIESSVHLPSPFQSQSVSQFRRGPRAHHTTVYYYFIVISLHNSFPSPPSAATAALADQRRGRGKPETFCRHRWARRALSCGHSARYSLTGTFQCLASRSGSVGLGVRSCTPVSASHSMSLFDRAPLVHAARQTSARMGCIV